MRKELVKVMFFGALALSTVTYVGCKDYDDDIDNLQSQIDTNKASIADLQKFVKEGKWVTSVDAITNGFKLTFSDGKSYEIVNGTNGTNGTDGTNGTNGTDGAPGINGNDGAPGTTIELSDDNYWIIDGVKTDICAAGTKGETGDKGETGAQGEAGKDGKSPIINAAGNWAMWNGTEYVESNPAISAAGKSMYITDVEGNKVALELHVYNKTTDKWDVVRLPKAAAITSMTLNSYGTTLYYGYNTQSAAVSFNNKSYEAGKLMISKGAVVKALINPAGVDASKYTINLTDSKGNSNFKVSKVAANMSETAITTRAAVTPNKGLYDLTLAFADGVDLKNLKSNILYALTTKDFYGNEIISGYDVSVNTYDKSNQDQFTATNISSKSADINQMYGLDYLTNFAGLQFVDYYYAAPESASDKALWERVGAKFNETKDSIMVTKEAYLPVKMHYLMVNGKIGTANIYVTFTASERPEQKIEDITWNMGKYNSLSTDKTVKTDITTLMNSLTAAGQRLSTNASIEFTDEAVIVNNVKVTYNWNSINFSTSTSAGKTVLSTTFNPASVTATSHNVSMPVVDNLTGNVVKTINFKVIVNADPAVLNPFIYRAGLVTDGKAKVYGTLTPGGVNYNMFNLYTSDVLDFFGSNVVFTDPATAPWLTSGNSLFVPTQNIIDGVEHKIVATYTPFNNTNLAKIVDEVGVKVVSPIANGTIVPVKVIEVDADVNTLDISAESFTFKDAKDIEYKLNEMTRDGGVIVSNKVTLGDTNARDYLVFADGANTHSFAYDNATPAVPVKITLNKKNLVTVNTDVECKIKLEVKDNWGVTTTSDLIIKLKAKK